MFKKIVWSYILLWLVLLSAAPADAQGLFHKRYGTDFRDNANKAIQTQEGNYIVVGTTWGFGSASNAYIMKLDDMGDQIWIRNYPGINADEIFDVIEELNGELVVCGGTFSYGAGYWDGFVMKTDSSGNMLWGHTYGNEFNDILYTIKDDKAGGYYAAGYVQQAIGSNQAGTVLMRLDSFGEIVWSNWLHGAWSAIGAVPIDLFITPTGDVLLTTIHGGHTLDLWKFNSNGQLLWNKTFDKESQGQRIVMDLDGNIYVTCYRALGNGNFSIDMSILKLDGNGDVEWCQSYGGTYIDFAQAIAAPNTGGVVVAGYTNSSGQGSYDAFLLRLAEDGSVVWGNTYGTVWDDYPNSVELTSDGGFLIAGMAYSYGSNLDSLKVYVVKTDEYGIADCNSMPWSPTVLSDTLTLETTVIVPGVYAMQEGTLAWPSDPVLFRPASICANVSVSIEDPSKDVHLLEVRPNPFQDQLFISMREPQAKRSMLSVSDMSGRVVYQNNSPNAIQNGRVRLELGHLSSGVYNLVVTTEQERKSIRVVKQ